MARDELLSFTRAAKARGLNDETIAGMLKASGWSDQDVYGALREHYEQVEGLRAPVRKGIAEGARDAFIYLLSFGTLGTWTVAAGSLLFSLIDNMFPDPVMPAGYAGGYASAQALASVLVAFPVFLLTNRAAIRDRSDDPQKRESSIRKWLTWFALLIAASVVIGDLITFLAYLLRGEISVRFVLKVLTVLVLAGGVFWYYISSLRAEIGHRGFEVGASLLVLGSLIAGFTMLGSPGNQRSLEADRRRVERLRAIAAELNVRGEPLPQSIEELRTPTTDPITGAPFEYRPQGGSRYQLCAAFEADSEPAERRYPGFLWTHGPGRTCFTLDATRPVP